MELEHKIAQSLRIIKNLYSDKQDNLLAFSGGKDSIVLQHLARISGLKFSYIYSNTTIDPPGHLNFIRKNYPFVQISQPKYSFYQIIEKYGLPTRHRRFCCQHLKEYVGKNSKIFEGLRIDEGIKRGKRLSSLKEPEQCDTRIKGKIHAYPLLYWSESDIWAYIKQNNLPFPEIYNKGFSRLGCIGCPLAYKKQRLFEFITFPKYAYATVKAIDKNIYAKKSLSKFFNNPYEAFYWWLTEKSIYQHKEEQIFKIDYEQIFKSTFIINKNI